METKTKLEVKVSEVGPKFAKVGSESSYVIG